MVGFEIRSRLHDVSNLRCYPLGGMFPGAALGGVLTLNDVVASIARLQKELSGVVKATIESTLGQLGTEQWSNGCG